MGGWPCFVGFPLATSPTIQAAHVAPAPAPSRRLLPPCAPLSLRSGGVRPRRRRRMREVVTDFFGIVVFPKLASLCSFRHGPDWRRDLSQDCRAAVVAGNQDGLETRQWAAPPRCRRHRFDRSNRRICGRIAVVGYDASRGGHRHCQSICLTRMLKSRFESAHSRHARNRATRFSPSPASSHTHTGAFSWALQTR